MAHLLEFLTELDGIGIVLTLVIASCGGSSYLDGSLGAISVGDHLSVLLKYLYHKQMRVLLGHAPQLA